MQPQGYLLFAISIPNFILGTFILLRNIKDPINVFFSAFAFSVGLWAFGLAGFIFADKADAATTWAQIYYSAAAIIASTFLLFSLSFTRKWPKLSAKHVYTILPTIILLSQIFLNPTFLMSEIAYRDWGKEVILDKSGYLVYTVYFVIYVAVGFVVMLKKMACTKGVERTYFRFVSVGLFVAFAMGAAFDLFLPFFGNYKYIWIGPLFTLFYIALISYAIVKHRMFDIRLIIVRALGYVLSISLIGTIFGVVVFGVVDEVVESNQLSALTQKNLFTLAAISIAFTFQPLKKFFDRMTNKLFYRDAYDPQAFLEELNKVLASTLDLRELLNRSSEVIQNNIKSEFCLFELKETESEEQRIIGTTEKSFSKQDIELALHKALMTKRMVIATDLLDSSHEALVSKLRRNDIAVLARLKISSEESAEGLGYIALGQKKSGNQYNSQDIKVMEIVANELVIAIQNALRFEEIQNFNVKLQHEIERATRQLQRNNDKLRALDETKDDFISMASHQLRTPLTSVKGYLSMVLEGDVGKLNSKQEKLLNQAFISSQRMVYLIADLLNVSRLRTGKFVIETRSTNLAEVIESEVEQLVETAATRGLKLEYKKPKQFPDLMLDETKIRQVIMNFVDNAIYYTPDGGHITVSLVDKPSTVQFTVEDNGIGVPKHEQHHLFTKFYRAGNARKARPDGTGLGLFMAKKVIISQGGSLLFRSAEGKGSMFGFTFAKAPLLPPAKPKTTEKAPV